jgi:lysophospholipase L1-like esterase
MAGAGGGAGDGSAAGAGGQMAQGGAGGSTANGPTPTTVWLAGDSTMQTCKSACPCGWGGEFQSLFNDKVKVVNSAVGGRSIQTWLYEGNVGAMGGGGECSLTSQAYADRWNAMLAESSGMQAGDTLLIQFGINDGDSACPRHVGLTLFKEYLTKMAGLAKERGATPVFLTPVSAIKCSGASAVATRGGFVTATKEAGQAGGVAVIDLHQLSIDHYTAIGLCPNDGDYGAGKVGQFFCADHTHFEAAGAAQIAGLVAQALKSQGLPLGSYVK